MANSQEQRDINFVNDHKRLQGVVGPYLFESNGSLPTLNNNKIDQRASYSTAGFMGEYALSFGVNLSEKVYIGVSAVARDVTKSLIYELYEESPDSDYRYYYERKHEVLGVGFGGKLGVFILPVPEFSIGISVQSPIFYSLTQRAEEYIKIPRGAASADPDIDKRYNYNPIDPVTEKPRLPETKYSLITPLQATLSFSYAVQNIALLTLDYEMTPYAMAQYSSTEGDAATLDANNTQLKDSNFGSSVRVGSEFYVWKGLTARLGGGYHTAPSANIKSAINVGLGAGYNFGDIVVDLAYVFRTQKQTYPLYTGSSLVDATYSKNLITLSLAYRF
jgi:long-subunit fatty acid transport protein